MSVGTKVTSARDFVKVYLTASSLDDAATTLGIKRGYVQGRAASLRKRGVALPKRFVGERVANRLNVADLNELVKELTQPVKPTTKGGKPK